jgi:hypothetical protein
MSFPPPTPLIKKEKKKKEKNINIPNYFFFPISIITNFPPQTIYDINFLTITHHVHIREDRHQHLHFNINRRR